MTEIVFFFLMENCYKCSTFVANFLANMYHIRMFVHVNQQIQFFVLQSKKQDGGFKVANETFRPKLYTQMQIMETPFHKTLSVFRLYNCIELKQRSVGNPNLTRQKAMSQKRTYSSGAEKRKNKKTEEEKKLPDQGMFA